MKVKLILARDVATNTFGFTQYKVVEVDIPVKTMTEWEVVGADLEGVTE